MCATHSLSLSFCLPPLCAHFSFSSQQQQRATCSVEILSTDAADFFPYLSLSFCRSFAYDFWPTSFCQNKKNRRKRSGASENWWNPKNVVVPLCRACHRAALAFATFFSLIFFFFCEFVVAVVGFAQLQNIFWSLTFSFAHFFAACLLPLLLRFVCVPLSRIPLAVPQPPSPHIRIL